MGDFGNSWKQLNLVRLYIIKPKLFKSYLGPSVLHLEFLILEVEKTSLVYCGIVGTAVMSGSSVFSSTRCFQHCLLASGSPIETSPVR